MRGKGGPENTSCKYSGVRQRTWGKWVSEISLPNRGERIWIGTFNNSKAAALAYDEAAIRIYGDTAKLNFPDQMSLSVHTTASTSSDAITDQNAIINDMPGFLRKLLEMQQGEYPPGDEVSLIANPYACLINDHVYDYRDQSVLHEGIHAVAPAVDQGKGRNVMKNDDYQKEKNDDNKEKMEELPESDDSSTDFSKIKDPGVDIAGISEYVLNDDWEGDLGSINFWLNGASYTLS